MYFGINLFECFNVIRLDQHHIVFKELKYVRIISSEIYTKYDFSINSSEIYTKYDYLVIASTQEES